MSPCSRMCVCVSISPGTHVERERSTTSAPAGTAATMSLIFPSSTTTTTVFVFAVDVCAIQHPAVATTKQIAAILRIMISSKGWPLLVFFIFILGIFRGFQCSGHHLERSRALLFEFGMRQWLARQHLVAHGGVVYEDRPHGCG